MPPLPRHMARYAKFARNCGGNTGEAVAPTVTTEGRLYHDRNAKAEGPRHLKNCERYSGAKQSCRESVE